jgi:hypothetical protein
MIIAPVKGDPETEAELRRLQKEFREKEWTPPTAKPYDPEEWKAIAGPPTAEDLAEMEQFLKDLNDEREASLAREVGITP